MKKFAAILLMLMVACTIAFSQERTNDPSGANTGNASDVTAAKAGEPTMAELANAVGHNKVAINMMWTLLTGLPGHVHADRFCNGGNGSDPSQERRPYLCDELHDLSPGHDRLLRSRLWDHVWRDWRRWQRWVAMRA